MRGMGAELRALALTHRAFDTFSHHTYGERAAERPWKRHDRSTTIALGDWQGLMQSLYDAFAGTSQPIPGQEGVTIWYTEAGFQTRPDPTKAGLYRGVESDVSALPDAGAGADPPDQATQFADAVRLAYCQPFVGAYLNFLLWDEPDLARWQSGLFWADRTPKRSYTVARNVIADVNARKVHCGSLPGGPVPRAFEPRTFVQVDRLVWPKSLVFNQRNDLWRFRIATAEDAAYTLQVVPIAARGTAVRRTGAASLEQTGTVRAGYFPWLKMSREQLAPGQYRFELTLTSVANPARTTAIAGPAFTVGKR
jgi:hypothetical protein